jgi:hypothetical protein
MKRPYEKPTLIDLSLPTARAGRLPSGASPQGSCGTGTWAGQSYGDCQVGGSPALAGSCHTGSDDAGTNSCHNGVSVLL